MAFTVEQMKSLLQHELVTELEKDKYHCQDKAVPLHKSQQDYEHLTVLKTVRRDLLVERDIRDRCSGKAIALK